MSGRKSSEVSSLLSLGKRSRDEINRNLNSEINQNISKNENFLRKLENVENEVNAVNLSIDTQISDEVSKGELNNILNKLKLEKDKIKNTKLENFSDELNKKRMIEEEFVSLDKRTAEIERIIQNKWDYCDSEYSEANSIASRYEKGKKQLSSLGVQISNKLQKNMENMLGVDTAYRNIQNLEKEFRLKTKNIINTNNLAYINDVFDAIDENIAKKFMMSEFNTLKTEIKNLNQSNIEEKFNSLKNKLENFSQELTDKYNTYIFKKERAEKTLDEFLETVENFNLNNIKSYIKNKEELMDMYSFAETYKVSGVSREKFNENLEKIKELISKEDFDLAYSMTEKAKDTLNLEKQILNKEYERIISQLEYAQKVGLAGKDLGYNVDVSVSENGIQDGYNIKLTLYDEIIDFEPRINSDGTSSLNIDHQESVSGSCGNTMEKVMKALQGKGIMITDILKNGKSVIFRDKSSKASSSKDKEKSRN
ncbi:hypothetical protein [Fusobacterium pseudoperiodonticum]|uniref:hypothetical protein n=1 Tax=Fusobacterium pseudoperiodonticum TaxID=2663009 RepID=UPI000C1B432A|nr:hypothetical protein [Fusobacterium pseudoperiodonticum]PIM78738.1 hypothetical protein CTM69_04705 [Fusobacterium pseudoperiodonticum]